MGSYITRSDLDIPQDVLVQLTDDEGTGTADEAVVDNAIADAEAEIESYCGNRYTVPLSPVNMVKKLAKDIAAYNIYSRRDEVPQSVKDRHERAVSFLKDVSAGRAHIEGLTGVLSEDERTASAGKVTGGERTFGRDNLDDY